MSNLFGALDIADSERPFTSVQGRKVIWDATLVTFDQWNEDLMDATSKFVQATTTDHQERYELPGGGELEEEGFVGAITAEVNRSGSWDVSYPLRQFGRALGYDEVALAYLTMGQYEAVVQTILNQNNNLVFRHILRALFKNTTTAYTDRVYGALTIQPLANADSVVYPPVYGSTAEATETMYLAPNYTEATISDTNDPIKLIRDKLEPHYGYPEGGSPIVVLANTSAIPYVKLLTAFDSLPFYNVQPGANISVPANVDPSRIPAGGRVVGVAHGCTIVEWPRMVTGWLLGFHQDAPAPLKRRIDDVDGLGDGLVMVPGSADQDYPFHTAKWRHRFGYGVGNRLGAVACALNGTGTYSIATGYS